MKFTVYCHEIISGSDVGMHYSVSIEEAVSNAASYRAALSQLDPTGPPLGNLAIHKLIMRIPDVPMMIDLLNSPESILRTCLLIRERVIITVD